MTVSIRVDPRSAAEYPRERSVHVIDTTPAVPVYHGLRYTEVTRCADGSVVEWGLSDQTLCGMATNVTSAESRLPLRLARTFGRPCHRCWL